LAAKVFFPAEIHFQCKIFSLAEGIAQICYYFHTIKLNIKYRWYKFHQQNLSSCVENQGEPRRWQRRRFARQAALKSFSGSDFFPEQS
jgi:hypothetical protein